MAVGMGQIHGNVSFWDGRHRPAQLRWRRHPDTWHFPNLRRSEELLPGEEPPCSLTPPHLQVWLMEGLDLLHKGDVGIWTHR